MADRVCVEDVVAVGEDVGVAESVCVEDVVAVEEGVGVIV